MSQMEIDRVLAQIRSFSHNGPSGAGGIGGVGGSASPSAPAQSGATDSRTCCARASTPVNQTQQSAIEPRHRLRARHAGRRAAAGDARDAESHVSFRALTEVRNRLVNAYQEIMNMPI